MSLQELDFRSESTYNSSAVERIAWSPDTGNLVVEWKGGRAYVYTDVPEEHWNEMKKREEEPSLFNDSDEVSIGEYVSSVFKPQMRRQKREQSDKDNIEINEVYEEKGDYETLVGEYC